MQDLLDIGFQPIGAWQLGPNGLDLYLEALSEASPALYAFVVGKEVRYVGKTAGPLRRRLYGYLRPGDGQRTNIRVRQRILEALGIGESVAILGFAEPREQRIGRFRLSIPAGLEDDIIRQLRPPWNSTSDRREPIDASADETPTAGVTNDHVAPASAPRAPQAQPISIKPTFTVTIGRTYFRQGFFNVPVDHARYFAGHGAELRIRLAGRPAPIHAHINRTVNKNDVPRVMGGVHLRDWFQDRLSLGAPTRVIVHSRDEIEIQPA